MYRLKCRKATDHADHTTKTLTMKSALAGATFSLDEIALALELLDGKTGLLTGLLAGKQGWKCPVAPLATCCGSKSLKVILIDSDFRAYPVLNPLVTL